MYSLLRGGSTQPHLTREAPAFAASMIVAEAFYELHSFTLECVAFLGTWYALSWLVHVIAPVKPETRRT